MSRFKGQRGKTLFFWLSVLGSGLVAAYFLQSLLVVLVFIAVYFFCGFLPSGNASPVNQTPHQRADFVSDDTLVSDDAPDIAFSGDDDPSEDLTGAYFDTASHFYMDHD